MLLQDCAIHTDALTNPLAPIYLDLTSYSIEPEPTQHLLLTARTVVDISLSSLSRLLKFCDGIQYFMDLDLELIWFCQVCHILKLSTIR
jgi:hypothetical protein